MKRRSVVLGLGTLAVGSGATLTSASFTGSIGSSGEGLGVVSAANVNVGPGSTDYDDDMGNLNPGDLPAANVTDDGDSIDIDIVTRINASGESFSGLFEIANDSTDAVDVEIDFTEVNTLGGELSESDIKNAYAFKIDGTDISDDGDSVEIGIGEEEDVDLEIDFEDPNNIVPTLRQNVDRPSGNPFSGDVGTATRLVNEIEITATSVN